MSPAQLAAAKPDFEDRRLPEMLFRYRARNWPETLNPEEQARWEQFRRKSLTEKTARGGLVLSDYEARLAQLESQPGLPTKDKEILGQLREWGRGLVA